jgi:hypothetical protein
MRACRIGPSRRAEADREPVTTGAAHDVARDGGARCPSGVWIRSRPTDFLSDALESLDQLLDLRVPSLRRFAEQVDKLVDWPMERVNADVDDHVRESMRQSGAVFAPEARGGEDKPSA